MEIHYCFEAFTPSLKATEEKKMFGETNTFSFTDTMNFDPEDLFTEETYSYTDNPFTFYTTDYEPEGTGFEDFMMDSQPSPVSTDMSSECDMESAMEVICGDLSESLCLQLGISQDPMQWSEENVKAFISMLGQRCQKEINLSNFQINGTHLCVLPQEQLEQLAPTCAHMIHKCLEHLQNAAGPRYLSELQSPVSPFQQPPPTCESLPAYINYPQTVPCGPSPTYHPTHYISPSSQPETYFKFEGYETAPSPVHSISSMGSSGDESMPSPTTDHSGRITTMTPNHTGSIQLWQFLKELLLQPESYNYCIRFLDRSQGIFKIEDSVEVARLWGQRKNRPKMNYDKMSRSIRQYYRKKKKVPTATLR